MRVGREVETPGKAVDQKTAKSRMRLGRRIGLGDARFAQGR